MPTMQGYGAPRRPATTSRYPGAPNTGMTGGAPATGGVDPAWMQGPPQMQPRGTMPQGPAIAPTPQYQPPPTYAPPPAIRPRMTPASTGAAPPPVRDDPTLWRRALGIDEEDGYVPPGVTPQMQPPAPASPVGEEDALPAWMGGGPNIVGRGGGGPAMEAPPPEMQPQEPEYGYGAEDDLPGRYGQPQGPPMMDPSDSRGGSTEDDLLQQITAMVNRSHGGSLGGGKKFKGGKKNQPDLGDDGGVDPLPPDDDDDGEPIPGIDDNEELTPKEKKALKKARKKANKEANEPLGDDEKAKRLMNRYRAMLKVYQDMFRPQMAQANEQAALGEQNLMQGIEANTARSGGSGSGMAEWAKLATRGQRQARVGENLTDYQTQSHQAALNAALGTIGANSGSNQGDQPSDLDVWGPKILDMIGRGMQSYGQQ